MRTDGHRGDRRRIERAQIRVRSYSLSPGDMQPDPFIPVLAGQAEQGGLPLRPNRPQWSAPVISAKLVPQPSTQDRTRSVHRGAVRRWAAAWMSLRSSDRASAAYTPTAPYRHDPRLQAIVIRRQPILREPRIAGCEALGSGEQQCHSPLSAGATGSQIAQALPRVPKITMRPIAMPMMPRISATWDALRAPATSPAFHLFPTCAEKY